MGTSPDKAVAALACIIAALSWLSYRRSARARHRLLRELFAQAAAVAGFEPEAVLVVQPQLGSDAEFGTRIRHAPRSWHVVLAGPSWLAELKSVAWRRPVSGRALLPFGAGALKEGSYLAMRRGRRFELVHELLPYMERLGPPWPKVGVESPSAAADTASDRLLQ
ncbi:hypothetical protein [Cohnella hashimotonis]|uniref:NERD domain-containing protein n=1 Tax=Cohnella hashimotonis TaxID=2826895 RepID=A0ABT6TBZ2_9BACL|nr:hypothetical protein [Cohnella hashimotonis]MDI4644362.1 hypothetical protein [Cohnella hashimotonis]